MKRIIILSLLITLFVMSCSSTNKEKTEDMFYDKFFYGINDPSKWPESCLNFKKNELNDPWVQMAISERPEVQLDKPVWLIKFNDIDVPIPETSYNAILIKRNKDSGVSFWLKHDDNIAIQISSIDTGTLDELNVTQREYARHTLKYTSDDLTCCELCFHEAFIAMLLFNKKMSKPVFVSEPKNIYQQIGDYHGWIVKSDMGEKSIEWDARFAQNSKVSVSNFVTYLVRRGHDYENIGLYLGAHKKQIDSNTPGWLSALNIALQSDDITDWDRFLNIAKDAGFTSESLNISAERIGVKNLNERGHR